MARIFISYRRDDTAGYALMLNKTLSAHFGADHVFMDIGGIPPGADFRQVINEAVGECSVLVALIGVHWLTLADEQGRRRIDNPGDFVRLEIASALGREIPVIPALVRGAMMPASDDLPDDLSELGWRQAIELSDPRWDEDTDRLIAALEPLLEQSTVAATAVEKPVLPEDFEPETVLVPAGPFVMGSDPGKDSQAFGNEFPQQTITVNDFRIGKYPVTVGQYRVFIEAGGYDAAHYWTEAGWRLRQSNAWTAPLEWSNSIWTWDPLLPVIGVSWYEAYAYCQWLGVHTGHNYRLAQEREWEKAARGSNGRLYPWGDKWQLLRCNSSEAGMGQTTSVSTYSPHGDSPHRVSDMVGNVWEWCQTHWRDSYHDPAPHGPLEETFREVRGGSWQDDLACARVACRKGLHQATRETSLGFRVMREV